MQEALKANPYEYAGDDPVNEVDPSGKISFFDAFGQCASSGEFVFTGLFGSAVGAVATVVESLILGVIAAAIILPLLGYCTGIALTDAYQQPIDDWFNNLGNQLLGPDPGPGARPYDGNN